MKAHPTTLVDRLYRESFSNRPVMRWTNNAVMREKLRAARRFVLDDGMSVMVAELATAAFIPRREVTVAYFEDPRNRHQRVTRIEQMRHSARAPFPTTWVEYNLRASMTRSNELLGKVYDPADSPAIEGWLIEQHPGIDTAFILTLFSGNAADETDDVGFDTWTFPVSYAWVTDDTSVLPWREPWPLPPGSASPSEVATGLPGYVSDRIGIVQCPMIEPQTRSPAMVGLLREWAGVMRRVLALMATIADLPIAMREVKAAKGFIGKGSYRRYLDHQTITLTVPASQYNKVARNAIAAARKRAHGVRGHWRIHWMHRPDPLCDHV